MLDFFYSVPSNVGFPQLLSTPCSPCDKKIKIFENYSPNGVQVNLFFELMKSAFYKKIFNWGQLYTLGCQLAYIVLIFIVWSYFVDHKFIFLFCCFIIIFFSYLVFFSSTHVQLADVSICSNTEHILNVPCVCFFTLSYSLNMNRTILSIAVFALIAVFCAQVS